MDDLITYMGYEWVESRNGVVTIGVNDSGLDEFTDILSIDLPGEGEDVAPDEVFGEVETDQGPMNLYSPIAGNIIEVNESVIERPGLIQDDCYGDGWLIRVEPANPRDADQLDQVKANDLEEGEDDDYS